MSDPLTPRETVARSLAIDERLLIRYEARGLVRPLREGAAEGYGPAEIRLAWTILSLHRDLGINLAGVEAILRLRAHLRAVHRRLDDLARDLDAALEGDLEPTEE